MKFHTTLTVAVSTAVDPGVVGDPHRHGDGGRCLVRAGRERHSLAGGLERAVPVEVPRVRQRAAVGVVPVADSVIDCPSTTV